MSLEVTCAAERSEVGGCADTIADPAVMPMKVVDNKMLGRATHGAPVAVTFKDGGSVPVESPLNPGIANGLSNSAIVGVGGAPTCSNALSMSSVRRSPRGPLSLLRALRAASEHARRRAASAGLLSDPRPGKLAATGVPAGLLARLRGYKHRTADHAGVFVRGTIRHVVTAPFGVGHAPGGCNRAGAPSMSMVPHTWKALGL